MLFTEKDIEEQFSTDIIKRAKALIRHSQINFSRTERDGGLLIAIVEEADKPPFRIYVRTQKKHHKLSIQGECNCQYRTNCEHVVAALLQSLLNQKAQKNMLATDESKKPCSMEKSGQWRPRLASHQSLCFRLKIKNAEVGVEPCVAKRLVDGNYSTGRYFAPVKMRGRVPPSFITPLDMEILELLSDLPGRFEKNIPCLKGDKASHVLEMLLNSGRCFLEELEKNRQMSLGTNQKLEYHWQIDEHGYQCLNGHFFSKETQILLLDTPWYVAHRTGKCGRLLSDLQIPFIEELIRLSPVAPDQIEKISQHLEKHWPEAKYPALKQISIRTLPLTTRPVPCLGLISVNEKEKQGKDFLRLSFLYGDKNVALYDKGTFFEGEELVQLVRDEAVEREAVQQLLAAGFHEIEDKTGFYFVPENNHAEAWQNFQIDILPGLRDLGWHVEYDNFRYRIYKAKQWVCEAFRHHTADWFSLKLALDVEGNKIDLLPLLLALLKQFSCKLPSRDEIVTEYFMVPFDNKAGKECRLQLPVSRVLPLLDILIEVHQNASASEIRCNQGQLAKFATL
ncbi:MAG TPA: hypothetical protein ENK06_07885, partial [Gammaproteobacteria bacterium]|nr:hypothetical protein [Gammaproteobacteria bacterium]